MSFLTAVPGQDPVYEIEDNDDAQGGPGQLMNFQAQALLNRWQYLYNYLTGVWLTLGTLSATTTGSGSFTLGTVSYKKYKQFGNTLIIQISVTGCHVTGTPVGLVIFPQNPAAAGGGFQNVGVPLSGGSYNLNDGSGVLPLFAAVDNPSGNAAIYLKQNVAWGATTTLDLFIDLKCEFN